MGASSAVAVAVLVTRQPPNWTPGLAAAYRWAQWMGYPLAAVALWSAHRLLGLGADELGLRVSHRTASEFAKAMGAGYLSMWLGMVVVLGFMPSWLDDSVIAALGERPVWDRVQGSVRAGWVEETVLLALPMAIASRLRWPWWAQLIVLVVLRLPFHLYYGPGALAAVLAWVALLRFAYARTVLVWPFMAAHILYDLNVWLFTGLVRPLLTLVLLGLGVWASVTWWRSGAAPDRRKLPSRWRGQ
ncbi:type II CAAX prenyl endopeptidase Rce1 family protein [Nocardia terpenica]|nr:CPBP family glutamic-type intramembrane protease [Nocardia terpenica]NQE92969.1 hypothetical protein [Nocardia terpenica]